MTSTNTDRPQEPKYHTQTNPGSWEKKMEEHKIKISYVGSDKIRVDVPLQSTLRPPHFIEAILLQDDKEKEIKAKIFEPSYTAADAEFKLPDSTKKYYIVIKCNLHDMWMAPVPPRQK